MKKIFGLIVAVSALGIVAAPAMAATFSTGEQAVAITTPVADDAYVVGTFVEVTAAVAQDLMAAGQSVVIKDSVGGDIFVAGEAVSLDKARVADDVHAAGAEVTVTEAAITGDLFAAGQKVQIATGTTVGGDAYLAGETITVAGEIDGDVRIAGAAITIEAGATIHGNLTTYGNTQPTIAEGARIEGTTQHIQQEFEKRGGGLMAWITSVISLWLLALVLNYLAPRFTQQVLATAKAQAGKSALFGLGWYVLLIPAAVILAISLVGIPLVIGLIAVTVLLTLMATALAALAIGTYVQQKLNSSGGERTNKFWIQALLGAVIYQAVQALPLIGGLATLILVLVMMGAILLTFRANRTRA